MHQSEQNRNGENGHIPFEKLPNTRDLGGIATQEGSRILPRQLLRSGMLAQASNNDIQVLTEEYELSAVIDLRTEEEREHKPDPAEKFSGVRFYDISILSQEAVGITYGGSDHFAKELEELMRNPVAMMGGLYSEMVLRSDSQQGFKAFFDTVLETNNGSVLWHCTLGKDRAGLAAYLLLRALGVSEEIAAEDYLATNKFMRSTGQDILEEIAKFPIPSHIKEGIRVIDSADIRFLQAALDSIVTEYGDMQTYLDEAIGIDTYKVETLKEKYLEK